MMIRSTPALSVCIEMGQVPHAPDQAHVDHTVVVELAELDVAAVALQRRADELDGIADALLQLGGFEIGVDRHENSPLTIGSFAAPQDTCGGTTHFPTADGRQLVPVDWLTRCATGYRRRGPLAPSVDSLLVWLTRCAPYRRRSLRALTAPPAPASADDLRASPDHVGAERPQAGGEVGVAPIDVMGVEHDGLALGGEPGEHQGGPRPHVERPHRRTGQALARRGRRHDGPRGARRHPSG